jgi:hypothetical protein
MPWRHKGGGEVELPLFFTWALDGGKQTATHTGHFNIRIEPSHSLNVRLGWPHNWSGHFTEEKKLLKLLIQTLDHRAQGPFTTLTMLSQQPVLHIFIYNYWHCGIASLWYNIVWKVGTNALEQHTVSTIKVEGSVFLHNFSNQTTLQTVSQPRRPQHDCHQFKNPESHTHWCTLPLPPKTKGYCVRCVHRF